MTNFVLICSLVQRHSYMHNFTTIILGLSVQEYIARPKYIIRSFKA